jgi:hypothetical protein
MGIIRIIQRKKCDFKMNSFNPQFPLLPLICLSVNNNKSLSSGVNIQTVCFAACREVRGHSRSRCSSVLQYSTGSTQTSHRHYYGLLRFLVVCQNNLINALRPTRKSPFMRLSEAGVVTGQYS